MASTYDLYQRVTRFPFGDRIFSLAFTMRAPYFRTVRPRVTDLRPHYAAVRLPKRKAVHNHIATIHAIAVCNGLEAAMGMLAEATTPRGWRWLPKGMEVSYVAKATSDLICVAETSQSDWDAAPEVPVHVYATRDDGTVVVEGTIHLWVTQKPTS
ncbi:MAG TPA: hotdog fold domain-containing protein [Nocardioidaceae bacterium]|nr:hotdog fold domain-containing protein [Nocardioidaceae bacterium]